MNKKFLATFLIAAVVIGSAALVLATRDNETAISKVDIKRATQVSETITETESRLKAQSSWKAPVRTRPMERVSPAEIQPAVESGYGSRSPQPDTILYHSEDPTYYYNNDAWMSVRYTVMTDSFELRSMYIWSLNDGGNTADCSLYVTGTKWEPIYSQWVPDMANIHWSGIYTTTLPTWGYFQVDMDDSVMFQLNDDFHIVWGEQLGGTGWYAIMDGDGTITSRSMYNFDAGRPDTSWYTVDMDLICGAGGEHYGSFADLWVRAIYNDRDLFFPHPDSNIQLSAEVRNAGLDVVTSYTISFRVIDTTGSNVFSDNAVVTEAINPGHVRLIQCPSTWLPDSAGEYVALAALAASTPSDVVPGNDTCGMQQQPFDSTHLDYTDPFEHSYMMVHFVDGADCAMKCVPHCGAVMVDSMGFAVNFEYQESTWVELFVWEADKIGNPGNLVWNDSVKLRLHPDTVYYFTVDLTEDTVEVMGEALVVGIGAYDTLNTPSGVQVIRPLYEIAPVDACPDGPTDGGNARMHPVNFQRFIGSMWGTGNNDWIIDAHVHCITPYENEVQPTQIQYPTNANWLDPDSTYTVQATVRNNGTQQATFNVYASDGQSKWTGSATVSNLGYKETRTVSFSPLWDPDTCINYRFTIYTDLVGDEKPENDTIVGTIIRATYPDSCELVMDDGHFSGTVYWLSPDAMWGNEFLASECSFDSAYISHVWLYTGTMLGAWGPPYEDGFPDPIPDPFELSIWKDTNADNEPDLMVSFDTVAGNLDSAGGIWWIPKPQPQVLHDEHFWVIMKNVPSRGNESVCYDTLLTYPNRQWLWIPDSGWIHPPDIEGDFIIEVWLDPDTTGGPGPSDEFIRGDADGSGQLTLGDGILCFRCQFVPGWQDSCRCDDALDADDGGSISIGDCLRILRKQFVPGWQDSIPPPCCSAPGDCGPDPTADGIGCDEHVPCGNPPGKIAPEQKIIGGELIPGRTAIKDGKLILPVYLSTNQELSGFAYTVSYDPSVLNFVSLETEGLITEHFDFISALPEHEEIAVGAVVSFDFNSTLSKGKHHVANLVFEVERLDRDIRLKFTDADLVDVNVKSFTATLSEIVVRDLRRPKTFEMSQNYPNPVKTSGTIIRYQIPTSIHTTLTIYNLAGQVVKTLVNQAQTPGYYSVKWNGKDELGRKVSSGVYFYRLNAGEFTSTRKLVMAK